jgi:myo-inositol-1(or 4)-monophosphatase/deoxyribonuclease-2
MITTRVVAHRTVPLDARENSLDGIDVAARLRADVVEVDARRSFDGTAVLLHDPWLGRVQKVPLPLRWAPDNLLRKLKVPTLVEALERAHKHDLVVAIDVKDKGAAEAVLAAINATEAADRILPWSQHMPVVRFFIRAFPDVEAALLRDTFTEEEHDRLLADAEAIGARAISVHEDLGSPEFIERARQRGLGVYCMYHRLETQRERLARTAPAGLAGVVTNWPAQAREQLEQLKSDEFPP